LFGPNSSCIATLFRFKNLENFEAKLSCGLSSRGWGSPIGRSGFYAFRCKLTVTPAFQRGKLLQFQDFDQAYVERLRAGDFRTQEHFVIYFSELIQLKLRSRLRTPQAIEDVRQETFARVLTALRSPGGIRQPERLGAFVNSICNNVLLEHYRATSRDSSLEDEPDPDLPDPVTDVLGAVAIRQMQEKVREILEDMPEKDRRLIRAVFLEERDKDEVCEEIGVDRDYLRVLLHRAKQSFKSLYLKNIDRRPPGMTASR
jgi:RNA polymerase sigma-70 factor, ECF subfamily